MKSHFKIVAIFLLCLGGYAYGQSFSTFGVPLLKSKVTLQRKLPAFVQLPGDKVKLIVTAHADGGDLVEDFKSMLGAELLKNDPRLQIETSTGDSILTCTITEFSHPKPTTNSRPGMPTKKGTTTTENYTRVTGQMRVSFVARTRAGKTLGADNVVAKFDEEYEAAGNSFSPGVVIDFTKRSAKQITGAKPEDYNPPTDSQLRTLLMNSAVKQIVAQVVNTREFVSVALAKGKGLDQGVKDAEAGLWPRALETWETANPLPKPVDDAYRLYDVGVAYEALGYAADTVPSAVTYLQKASTQYGMAIDQNPGEKSFLEPQRRIETALAHYAKLEDQEKKHPAEVAAAPSTRKTQR